MNPYRWRNAVGMGVFIVVCLQNYIPSMYLTRYSLQAKDCVNLFHLWLTKREIETRRVKNRSFAGVDIRELDLIKPSSRSQ